MAQDAFGVAALAIIEQLIFAKMPPHLKKSNKQAHLENRTYAQIVSHLEEEFEFNGLKAPDELQIDTVMQQVTKPIPEKPKQTRHDSKISGNNRNQCHQLKRRKDQVQCNTNRAGNNNNNISGQTNSYPINKNTNNSNTNNANSRNDRKLRSVYPP